MDVQGVNANRVNARRRCFGNKRTWTRWAIKNSLPGKCLHRHAEHGVVITGKSAEELHGVEPKCGYGHGCSVPSLVNSC
jgi:hypothetical protein